MLRLLLGIIILGLTGCSDIPYQEKMIAKLEMESPVIELKSPTQNALLSQKHIPLKGRISRPELVKSMQVAYWGVSESNEKFKGTKDISIKTGQNEWNVEVGNDLSDGQYIFSVSAKDIHGKEQILPEVKITIDQQPPEILGAADGISQALYRQETVHYRQKLVDEKGKLRYEIEPIEEPAPLNYRQVPMIYRWLTRIGDEQTAPSYTIKLADESESVQVRYGLSYECKSLEAATKEAQKKEDGTYEIKITQSAADFDLSRDSEANARGKSYCLSIWAVDQAGNASNHRVEFIWKVIAPPIGLDVNSARYKAYRREDDISWLGPPVWKLFRNGTPIALKKDLVIGHVIMANPFSSPISSKLELSKRFDLKINGRLYQVPEKLIDIKYFGYDLQNNELGLDATLDDGSVMLNAQKAVIAKFILTKEILITGVVSPDAGFWTSFSLEVGFAKTGSGKPLVDGLMLVTRDAGIGIVSGEFTVPWGSDHEVRRRTAPREAH